MSKLRIGFVGVGFMGQMAHLRNYAALPECEVAAVSELRPHLGQEVARRYGVPKVFKNHLEMLDQCELDGIVASQPYSHHVSLLPDILKRKIPLFTEKPLAISVESGAKLAALTEELQTLYMVGYHKRSDMAMEYAVRIIREWKESGQYGAMRLVRATMPPGDWVAGGNQGYCDSGEIYPILEMESKPENMDQASFNEYNSFVNYYIHQVNALRFLLQEPYKVTYASSSGALLAGESHSGVTVTLEMAPYEIRYGWDESYLVGFEHGYVLVELPAPLASQLPGRVTIMRDSTQELAPITETPVLPRRHAMLNQAANFLAAIRGDRPAPCTVCEALEDLKVAMEYIRLKRGS